MQEVVGRDRRGCNPDKVDLFEAVDMSAPDVGISEQELFDRYQIQPVATSIFSPAIPFICIS